MKRMTRNPIHALALIALLAAFGNAAAQEVFVASLSGDNVVPPVATDASGTAVGLLVGNVLVVGGFYENLSSPVATQIAGGLHIHMGAAGENGGVIFRVSNDAGTSGTFSGTYVLSDDQVTALRNGMFYLQLHTENFNPGELRGQLLLR